MPVANIAIVSSGATATRTLPVSMRSTLTRSVPDSQLTIAAPATVNTSRSIQRPRPASDWRSDNSDVTPTIMNG